MKTYEIIKQEREKKGLSKNEFARLMRISNDYVNILESKSINYRYKTLKNLCIVLEIHPDLLLYADDSIKIASFKD